MIPNRTKTQLLNGAFDFQNDTIRVALLKESTEYTPDPDSHEFVSDVLDGGITGEEFDDANYTRKTLTSTTTAQDNTADEARFDADDLRWNALGGTQRVEAILIYKQVGVDDTTPGDDPILRVIDDSETTDLSIGTDSGDFDIVWRRGILGVA